MGELTYRRCDQGDLELLTSIAGKTFHDTFASYNRHENITQYINAAFNLESIEKELLEPKSEFYFALNGDELVGYFKINSQDPKQI